MTTPTIHEPAGQIPICHEADLCVIGGSTTGLFAAVAAARLGMRVALVEAMGYFGGTATASLVTVWHSHFDEIGKTQIIGGLVTETMERLKKRDAVIDRGHELSWQYAFEPHELIIELDEMVRELPQIRPFLHTRFCKPVMSEPGRIEAVIIEDKTGRRAIRASMFIDASGDGDLLHRAGLETYRRPVIQPPTATMLVTGMEHVKDDIRKYVFDPKLPGFLKPGFLWGAPLPGEKLRLIAGTRVHGADCSDADQLTAAEIEGRRQTRAILDIIRRHVPGGEKVRLAGLPARIGIRESRHARCLHELTEREVLHGVRFDDAIANGSYRVDVHAGDGDGLVFRYLSGKQTTHYAGGKYTEERWAPADHQPATFYQVPYRSLVPRGAKNVLAAGRCIDADEGAFGAMRVMVNAGQTGHAAGVAATLAIRNRCTVDSVNTGELRKTLQQQNAVIF